MPIKFILKGENMKKKSLLGLLLAVCIVGITACESSGNSSKPEEEKESISSAEANTVMNEVDSAENELSESEQEEYDLVSKYFDIKEYEENDGLIKDNKTDKVLSSMIVDNTRFEIGMSYDEILSLGYKPAEESFAEEKPKGVVVLGEFINDKESSVRLGFASRDYSDSNITVSDGSYLYEISVYPESNTFSIDEISEYSTISDIIDVFGNPCRIDAGCYSDFPDMKMVYESRELSQYLTFYVNLETEKIVAVHLEGYPQ